MPDLTAALLRQRRSQRCAFMATALTLGIGLAACKPSPNDPAENVPHAAETAAAENAEASGEPDDSPADSRPFAGPLEALDTPGDARHLDALIPVGNGHLLIGQFTNRTGTTFRTWRMEGGPTDTVTPLADETHVAHRGNAAPQIVAVPERGAIAVRPTDNLGMEGTTSSFTTRGIAPDGTIDESPAIVTIPGWVFREAWTATRLGDDALVCFLGAPGTPLDAAPINQLACGVLTFEGTWRVAPQPVAEGPVALVTPYADGGSDAHALVTWGDPSTGHVHGAIAQMEDDALTFTDPIALTSTPIVDSADFAYRRPPVFLATEAGIPYIFPATASQQAQAGSLFLDGTAMGERRDVISLAAHLEAPRMVHGVRAPVLLYDATGREGERTAIVFLPDNPFVTDIVGMFSPADPRRRSRLGPGFDNLLTFVFDMDGVTKVSLREMTGL